MDSIPFDIQYMILEYIPYIEWITIIKKVNKLHKNLVSKAVLVRLKLINYSSEQLVALAYTCSHKHKLDIILSVCCICQGLKRGAMPYHCYRCGKYICSTDGAHQISMTHRLRTYCNQHLQDQ